MRESTFVQVFLFMCVLGFVAFICALPLAWLARLVVERVDSWILGVAMLLIGVAFELAVLIQILEWLYFTKVTE